MADRQPPALGSIPSFSLSHDVRIKASLCDSKTGIWSRRAFHLPLIMRIRNAPDLISTCNEVMSIEQNKFCCRTDRWNCPASSLCLWGTEEEELASSRTLQWFQCERSSCTPAPLASRVVSSKRNFSQNLCRVWFNVHGAICSLRRTLTALSSH